MKKAQKFTPPYLMGHNEYLSFLKSYAEVKKEGKKISFDSFAKQYYTK